MWIHSDDHGLPLRLLLDVSFSAVREFLHDAEIVLRRCTGACRKSMGLLIKRSSDVSTSRKEFVCECVEVRKTPSLKIKCSALRRRRDAREKMNAPGQSILHRQPDEFHTSHSNRRQSPLHCGHLHNPKAFPYGPSQRI